MPVLFDKEEEALCIWQSSAAIAVTSTLTKPSARGLSKPPWILAAVRVVKWFAYTAGRAAYFLRPGGRPKTVANTTAARFERRERRDL